LTGPVGVGVGSECLPDYAARAEFSSAAGVRSDWLFLLLGERAKESAWRVGSVRERQTVAIMQAINLTVSPVAK